MRRTPSSKGGGGAGDGGPQGERLAAVAGLGLGRPLAEAVEGLHLDDAVSGALLARSGDLGSALTLVEAVEMLNPERVQQTARDLDLDLEDLQDMDGHAHAWVHDLVRE